MRSIIIYQSICHKNTEKIAEVIGKTINAKLITINKASEININDYDLIGFGSGIFYQNHHKSLLNYVDELKELNKKVFIFSTSGFATKSLHKKLRKKLVEKSAHIVGEFPCKGLDTWGPFKLFGGLNKGRPNEKDFEKAKKFAQELIK